MIGDRRFLDRVAEMEYVLFRAPHHTRPEQFGTFIHHQDFPTRYDCAQLFDCRCAPGHAGRFLEELERLYGGTRLPHRKISFHDVATAAALRPALSRQGWHVTPGRMTIFRALPRRTLNPAVTVKAVDPYHPDLVALMTDMGRLEGGFAYHRSQTSRTGGEWVVAYLDERPVGSTGWFVHDHMARFRFIGTTESARNVGVASALVRHVQDHPTVREQDALVIMVNDDGPVRLYEDLGFRSVGRIWDAVRFLPGFDD